MAKRVTITIKNDEVLTFLDRRVKEFNDRQTDESEKINRTDYINAILEREMVEKLGLNQRMMLDMNTKIDQNHIMIKAIAKMLHDYNVGLKELIDEITLD